MEPRQYDTERVIHSCLLHGEYQKFKAESVQGCPKCLSEKETEQDRELVKKQSFSGAKMLKKVNVKCDLHKNTVLEVPVFLSDMDIVCPHCVKDKRERKLGPAEKAFYKQAVKSAGIPENHLGKQFSKVDMGRSEKQGLIAARLINYVKDVVKKGDCRNAKNILFSGNMGTGKTLFASILMQEVVRRSMAANIADEADFSLKGGLSVQFLSEPALKDEITASWDKGNTDTVQKIVSRYSAKGILCIDDVGLVSSGHAHLLDVYANIIDERYKRCLPTIITTNLHSDDLVHAIGARSVDRFFEKNRIIVANFDWSGYRTAERGTDEIEVF
ncbi:ATP-binding protein [Acinetobacter sp. ANC 3813]|uniref:ATP-binding protein n=1 Tax=Acinetobacter sp. ANC 3813 TaxID=1977873 RepID=UPI000A35008F|nr:ATP-binding protein [Acinetobacter sp. ANC 3813]OTG87849.1 hypothetical protein B9T34_16060 [Acinetobacter sp. ANC 3813]